MKTKKPATDTKQPRTKIYMAIAVVALVLLIGCGILLSWFYSDRALPNVSVGGVSVGNQQPVAIRQVIAAQAPALRITFDDNGTKTTVLASDLGVHVDVAATTDNALKARRGGDLAFWQSVNVPLVLANDPGVLIDFAKKKFPNVFVDAREPQIVYDDVANSFVVRSGAPGRGLDIKSFERALPYLARNPDNFTLKLTSAEVEPILDETKMHEAKAEANSRLDQKIEFKLGDEVIYTASRSDVAGWMHFVPDATKGTVAIDVDKAAIHKFLSDKVGAAVAAPPIDRKVVIDQATGVETVIQAGRSGSQIEGVDDLTGEIVSAINGGRSLISSVSIAKAPFKTVTMSSLGKWIEVDLSQQRLTLYVGNEVVKSFTVSTGRAVTPTQIGESAVYLKRTSMTMTGTIAGDYYYIPDVKWVSFFNGGEAIHGTYWHNNFGTPMSHGCINMSEADAKTVFDFAPVGTKVIVHS